METNPHASPVHLRSATATTLTRASSPLLGREHAAYRFLESTWFAHDGLFPCWTSASATFETRTAVPPEVFTSMVVLEALKDSRLSETVKDDIVELLAVTRSRAAVHHFFLEKEKLPADADCTGIAHSLLWEAGLLDEAAAQATAQAITRNTDDRGVLAVYFTDAADRQGVVDPVVCANALHFLNRVGAAGRAEATERFLFETLEKRAYLAGTRYYPSPETFLFFVSRLAADFPVRYQGLLPMLRSHVGGRLGRSASPLELVSDRCGQPVGASHRTREGPAAGPSAGERRLAGRRLLSLRAIRTRLWQ